MKPLSGCWKGWASFFLVAVLVLAGCGGGKDLSGLSVFERRVCGERSYRELLNVPKGEYTAHLVTMLGSNGNVYFGTVFDKAGDAFRLNLGSTFGPHVLTKKIGEGGRDALIEKCIAAMKRSEFQGFQYSVDDKLASIAEVHPLRYGGRVVGYLATVDGFVIIQGLKRGGVGTLDVPIAESGDFTDSTGAGGGGGGGGGAGGDGA
ncbi:MAG: hypothetical protein QF593_01130 [Nitrospinota bacterium]|nr:hypothetical protein [Nitrospinota bacterium]